jgi:hypothetical protein
VLVSRFATECLVCCDSFRTLADHAGLVASELRLGPAERGEMYRVLGRLAEAGLLTPLESWAPAAEPQEATVVDGLVLVSANRAASAGLRSYMTSRAVVRRFPSVTLNDNPAFMTYAVGFDCRELLPPLVPMLRNSDALFGSMLSLLQPDGLFGLLPWTIGHEPPEARFSDEASRLRHVTGIGAADYLAMLCRIWPATIAAGLPVEARFRSLGRHLVDVGKLPTGELEELLGSLYARDMARLLGMLEGLLEEFGGSLNSGLSRCVPLSRLKRKPCPGGKAYCRETLVAATARHGLRFFLTLFAGMVNSCLSGRISSVPPPVCVPGGYG